MNAGVAALLSRGAMFANRLRIALTLACIALGVALAGAVHTVHTSALAEIDRAARALAGAADLEVRGPRNGFDDAIFVAVAQRPEVLVANPIVEVEAAIPGGEGTLRVIGVDFLRAARLQPAFVSHLAGGGAAVAAELLDTRNAWLSPAAAFRLRLRAGDTLRLGSGTTTREFRMAGILAGLPSGGDFAAIDIAAAQAQFDRDGRLSRIELRLRSDVDSARFRETLGATLPAGVVVTQAADLSSRAAALTRAYRVNLDALALVALATGAFLVFSTLALQAARRRQEFALLRALGVTRRGLAGLLAFEGLLIGTIGALIGTALGIVASRQLLAGSGPDLGAGYFTARGADFLPDPVGLALIALLGVGMSVGGALWVARAVGRVQVAEALRDRAVDLPGGTSRLGGWIALGLALAGIPLLYLQPIGGLPIGGYGAIAAWLLASVVAVGPVCQSILALVAPSRNAVAALAVAQVRDLPGHLAASIAGIVVSASLCVAMAIMVNSFRVSLEYWLGGIVGADLYVRASPGETGAFTAEEQSRVAGLAEIGEMEPIRYDRIVLDERAAQMTLVARPIDDYVLAGFLAVPRGMPAPASEVPVWISEAAADLHAWRAGDRVMLPVAGRKVPVRVAGIVRDYARTWGAVLMPIEEYRRLTGDTLANDLAIHLASGVSPAQGKEAIRRALPQASDMAIEDAAALRKRSLEIFDRTFAITYALETIAVVIGLAGITSSFAALAWSRRREFGVLRFLGLRRRDVLKLLAVEGVAAGAVGAAIGLVAGVAISFVLVRVVNRQSFHWSMEIHWPVFTLFALVAGIVALCAFSARWSGAYAVRQEAVLAVKDDA